jgi:NAD(P)-dependent dehydrogenase (short-subunit alcohol dehydrogenase family)
MQTETHHSSSTPVFAGRVAIVTGANSGIGRGIAEAFAGAGAKVVVSGRTEDRNHAVVDAIRSAGGDAIAVRADVTSEEDNVALVARTLDTFGRCDICVANSGGTADVVDADIVDMDLETWRYVLSLNLDAVFVLYREVLRSMIPAGRGGTLISVSSVGSIRSTGRAFHYAAAKAGVNALTMSLAEYLGPHGIRINTIIPGFIESAQTAPILAAPNVRAGIEQRIPLRRVGVSAEVGDLAVFLASSQSSFITGTNFVIDGGQSCRMVSDAPAAM